MTIIEFSEWLQDVLTEKRMKPKTLADKAGLDPGIISRVLNRERMPSSDSLSSIAQPLETPTKPYHIGTWNTINQHIYADRTHESFRSSGVYWTSAWFVRYQGEWWRVTNSMENTLPELDYNDTTELIVERV